MYEYAIWGKTPEHDEETLLVTKLKTMEQVIRVKNLLANKYKCYDIRVQKIDLSNGFNQDFINTITLNL